MSKKGLSMFFCMELAFFDGGSFELLLRLFFVRFYMKGYGVAIGNPSSSLDSLKLLKAYLLVRIPNLCRCRARHINIYISFAIYRPPLVGFLFQIEIYTYIAMVTPYSKFELYTISGRPEYSDYKTPVCKH